MKSSGPSDRSGLPPQLARLVLLRIEFSLSDAGYAHLVNTGMVLKLEVTVLPGRYKVEAAVRKGVETKTGSLTKIAEVP